MNPPTEVDKAFTAWLVQRSLNPSQLPETHGKYSIAIKSPCVVCQPRIALSLAQYLSEFDEQETCSAWFPVTEHRLEQLQAHPEFRQMLGHDDPDDPESAIRFLSQQSCVILEFANCHLAASDNPNIFQVSLSCQEPSEGNHHLWINAKRIPEKTLIPMIANAFLDWIQNGGDRKSSET